VGCPGTTADGPLSTDVPVLSDTLMDESFGSGVSPNVISTLAVAC
jgi:hypothetical protein